MNHAKQIISVLPEASFLDHLDGANLVVITTDAEHGGRGLGWGGGGGLGTASRELFYGL